MRYLKWTNEEFFGLSNINGMVVLFTEDFKGVVYREIGFDEQGKLVHKCPDPRFEDGEYGLFDLSVITVVEDVRMEMSAEEFMSLWDSETYSKPGAGS